MMSVLDGSYTATTRAARVATAAVCAAFAFGQLAAADPVDAVNALRARGCAGIPAVGVSARRDAALDAAARELARDAKLGDALARVAYPVASSTSFRVRGSRDDATIGRVLGERYCERINDPVFTELGFHQSGDSTWIVMASRASMPFAALTDPAAVAERVLELVNEARAHERTCGRQRFGAAGPLKLSSTLTAAASLHSLDMAENGSLSHRGSDGSDSGERITRAGYVWRGSGENVASGQQDAETVVAGWLLSPGHCATLMEPNFTETGIAFALAPGKNPNVYWTQVFAVPR
jgi:uncharacterized protein YkwD